jgi:hypothetical protein
MVKETSDSKETEERITHDDRKISQRGWGRFHPVIGHKGP